MAIVFPVTIPNLVFYILSFYIGGEVVGQPVATTKSPARVSLGCGDCDPLFEECLKQAKHGERAEYWVGGSHPLFHNCCLWNGFDSLVKDQKDLEANPNRYKIKLEIEVSDIRPTRMREQPNIFELTTEEKRTRAEALKKQGDDEFKAQNFQNAADLYTKAYKLVFFEDGPVFNDLKFKIGSNLAFMNLKLKKYEDCVNMNDQFIRFGYEVSDKTFFRNGQASELYGRLEEAIKFYEKAVEVSKDEEYKKTLQAAIVAVQKKITDKKDQVRKNMQKMWS